MAYLITSRDDWSSSMLREIWDHIHDIGVNDLKMDLYENQFEIVSAEQMLDAYAAVGMPIGYSHWSFGKEYLKNATKYHGGKMGLALEMVINTSPTINYLMEENNGISQALVMAHAGVGHNFVFKNNYMFREWTTASSIIDYMIFAKKYIRECEEKYGEDKVESLLDAAHALATHSVDKRKRRHKKKKTEEDRQRELVEKADDAQKDLDIIIKTTSINTAEKEKTDEDLDKVDDEENIIYFIYKNSPILKDWQREILRIVYKIRQYFYPQSQDQCVTGNNLVATGHGLLRLDELISREGSLPVKGINLLTEGDTLTPISHTFLNKSAAVLSVKTKSGREFIGTPEHRLMALHRDSSSLVRLDRLCLHDSIVLNTDYQNVFATSEVRLRSNDNLPTTLSTELAELLGYLDAHCLDQEAVCRDHPEFFARRLSFLLLHLLNIKVTAVKTDVDPHRDTLIMFKLSPGVCEFLQSNFEFSKGGIPRAVRCSPLPVIRAYVRALFYSRARETLGTLRLNDPDIEKLRQLQIIFGALGCIAHLHENTLSIKDADFQRICSGGAAVGESVYYDKIVSISELPEPRAVYDVTVPKNHLFWMSGLISHNTLNEGMATHTHFYIMDKLEQQGLISPDAQIAWLHLHSSVIFQPDMHSKYYDACFNPYALGFDILKEVRRVCENPTSEDREWFPNLVDKDWRTEIKAAVSDYRDESFIEQFMTPALMRRYKMMTVAYNGNLGIVSDISDERGYRNMRRALAQQYANINRIPDIMINAARMRGDRTLTLEYKPYLGRSLHGYNAKATIKYVRQLWGYPVEIVERLENGYKVLFTS